MAIEKVRVLAEKNTTGIPNVIYIKGENLESIIKKYEQICKELKIEGTTQKIEKDYVLLSYDREEISSYIIKALKEEISEDEILKISKELLNKDWSYCLRKSLCKNNTPFILKENNCLQIGYGSNSIDVFENEEGTKNLKNNGNIPIISITGTNGKTTTSRLIHNTLGILGYKCGLSSTGGIYIGDKNIKLGDTTGYYSALEVLKNKEVNAAVLETARGGIIKKGLGFKNAKAGIITSLSEDHMGMEGINSIEELGKIKSLIKEGLSPDGVMIIKAQNEIYSLFSPKDKLVLFENEKNELINEHIKLGGEAFYTRNGLLINNYLGNEIELVKLSELEFAHFGMSKSNVRNIMAAIAAIKTFYPNVSKIMEAIKSLKCDMKTNKGRQNILDFKDFKMIIDYGHNSEAFYEVFEIAKSMPHTKLTGLITAAGDRKDKYIIELGEIASKYCDRVIIKEHEDKRGRTLGETSELLYKGLMNSGFSKENIEIHLKEEDAIERALKTAIKGEVIVSFSQFLNQTMPVIERFLKGIEENS
ncbi:MAG: Mur ligase family protein [Clostridium sp.]